MVQENSLRKKVLIICGPTASGKTSLAVECAKLLDSEIISADSMNIYKGFDIGTAKPNNEEKQGITHHLIDVVSPFEEFSVSDYKMLAEKSINGIFAKGKIPVICGGTGFYINSILYDLSYGNSSCNLVAREKYKKLAEEHGNEYVFSILKEKDPMSAEKLHYNDIKRVIRALEIYESGFKKSELNDKLIPKYDYKAYAIDFPRDELYNRINARVDIMIQNGLVEEVSRLKENGVDINNQCMQGIGYKEIFSYLNNEISLADAIELIKLNTRHYAKRQITFFKRLDELKLLKPESIETLAERIVNEL
jgi:tRNA dimethylallyltransferase